VESRSVRRSYLIRQIYFRALKRRGRDFGAGLKGVSWYCTTYIDDAGGQVERCNADGGNVGIVFAEVQNQFRWVPAGYEECCSFACRYADTIAAVTAGHGHASFISKYVLLIHYLRR
jgi:hypothetical protein